MVAVELEDRDDLVGDVVDQWVGAVAVLFDIGHDDPCQRRRRLGLAGHAQVRTDEVDVELRPFGGPDVGDRWQPYTLGAIAYGTAGADLEPEPVADVAASGFAQFRLGYLAGAGPVHVDIDRRSDAEVASQECRGSLDDPSVVDRVETFEQTVVGELPLEVWQSPAALGCDRAQPIREGAAECSGLP